MQDTPPPRSQFFYRYLFIYFLSFVLPLRNLSLKNGLLVQAMSERLKKLGYLVMGKFLGETQYRHRDGN